MDKHTEAILVWAFFVLACVLAFCANCRAWINGEVRRSSPNSFRFRIIRREENPESFKRYMLGMVIINAFFFLAVVIWGVELFFWP